MARALVPAAEWGGDGSANARDGMRPELPGTRHEFVEANGLRFSVATAGEGDHLALCLHGFPECWYSWQTELWPLKNGLKVIFESRTPGWGS